MKSLKKIRKTLSKHKEELRKRFKVKEIGIFSSSNIHIIFKEIWKRSAGVLAVSRLLF